MFLPIHYKISSSHHEKKFYFHFLFKNLKGIKILYETTLKVIIVIFREKTTAEFLHGGNSDKGKMHD